MSAIKIRMIVIKRDAQSGHSVSIHAHAILPHPAVSTRQLVPRRLHLLIGHCSPTGCAGCGF